ncbi:MAG: nucleotidyltransferase [Pseudomonadota bacterium]
MKNLKDLLEVLLKSKIDFILIGGYAGVVHGSSVVTQDIDICAVLTPENIKKLRMCLKDYDPSHRMTQKKLSFLRYPEKLNGIKNLYIETNLGVLDIIGDVSGVGSFEDVKKNAVEIKLYGHKCRVISVDDLIKSKETLKRPKDLIVAAELKSIKRSKK